MNYEDMLVVYSNYLEAEKELLEAEKEALLIALKYISEAKVEDYKGDPYIMIQYLQKAANLVLEKERERKEKQENPKSKTSVLQ